MAGARMTEARFSKREARMYAIGITIMGEEPLGANFFSSYFKGVSKKRAREMEGFQNDFSGQEIQMIKEATA
jgi:hypothetical protein